MHIATKENITKIRNLLLLPGVAIAVLVCLKLVVTKSTFFFLRQALP